MVEKTLLIVKVSRKWPQPFTKHKTAKTNLICYRSARKTYDDNIIICRTQIRPSEHDIVAISGQWLDLADTRTVHTAFDWPIANLDRVITISFPKIQLHTFSVFRFVTYLAVQEHHSFCNLCSIGNDPSFGYSIFLCTRTAALV